MIALAEIKDAVLHLLFPHVCAGCGSDKLGKENQLCLRCMAELPPTNFEWHAGNPVENIFIGRLPIHAATAKFYFAKESRVQLLMHQFKYKGNKELGLQLGKMMGEEIHNSGRFEVDAIIPLPLFPAKEKRRGYNQARVLAEGMASFMNLPLLDNVVSRPAHTETQTRKGRIERWKNIEGKFVLERPDLIQNKHILLVDDVITTGATLESCGAEILKAENCSLSIACLCIATR